MSLGVAYLLLVIGKQNSILLLLYRHGCNQDKSELLDVLRLNI